MNMFIAAVAAATLSATAVSATLPDFATARTSLRANVILTEGESNGPTRGGNDSAMLAEASQSSPGTRDSALG